MVKKAIHCEIAYGCEVSGWLAQESALKSAVDFILFAAHLSFKKIHFSGWRVRLLNLLLMYVAFAWHEFARNEDGAKYIFLPRHLLLALFFGPFPGSQFMMAVKKDLTCVAIVSRDLQGRH
jgi:hypothetical protein